MSPPARPVFTHPAPTCAHPAIQALLMAGEAAGRVSGEDLATTLEALSLEALALEAAALGKANSEVGSTSEESGVFGEPQLYPARQVEDGEAARQGLGETLNKLAHTAHQLQQELNREPTPQEIAEAVGACWDAARVPDAPKVTQEPVSLEVRTGHDVEQENF